MPMAGSQPHPVNIRSALRRNSLVSDPEDMLLLREKLTRIAVGSLAAQQQGVGDMEDEEEDEGEDEFDEHGGAGRYGTRRRRRPPPFQVFGLPPSERPSTPPSSPQPRDVLRRQLRLKKQVSAAARRRLGSASVAGSDEDEDGERSGRKYPLGATFVSVDEVEITRLEEAVGEACIAPPSVSVAAVSPTQGPGSASSPRVRLSIPSHLRLSSTFSVLSKCPEGMRKRKSVHVEEAAAAPAAASRHAMSRQGGGSLKKTSSQVNMLSHEHADDMGGRIFKSYSSGALFRRVEGDDSDDQDMEDAWPDPEPPESPEASLGHPEK